MKKYVKILSTFVLGVLAANACQKMAVELEQEPSEPVNQLLDRQLVVRASWNDDSSTKTVVSGTSVLWTPEEKLNLFYGAAYSGLFTSTNTEPVAVAEFTGFLSAIEGAVPQENDIYWAVYPYDAANTCDGQSVSLAVPSYQVASAGTFADNLFPAVARSANLEMTFHNVCGGVRFSVAGEGIRAVTFKGRGGENLAGRVKVTLDNEGLPLVQSITAGEAEVSVVAPDGGTFVPGTQYFAVLIPQALANGLELTFRKDSQWATYKMEQGVTVRRSRFGVLEGKDAGLTYENAPVDRLAFVDPVFAEYVFANFDTDSDGILSTEEQNNVQTITVSTEEISSLEGLSFFPKLKELSCYGQRVQNTTTGEYEITGKLTALDVSQNPLLEQLNCSYNQLTSLDVRQNTALKNLSCNYNQLTVLDVSQNSLLEQINVTSNQLTSLDLSHNPDLQYVYCELNQLTSLDVSACTEMRELYCDYNQLTSLDVTHSPYLTSLLCYYNVLGSLDISQNTELQTLYCQRNRLTALDISQNTKLKYLYCYNNQIASLDPTLNTELLNLIAYGNPLGSLDVTKNPLLMQLDVEDTGLTTLDLSFNPELNYLYCSENYFTDLDVSQNPKLNFLYALRNESLAHLYMQEGQSIARFSKPDYTEIVYVKNLYPDAFPDENFRSYVFENFDTNGNGIISHTERMEVQQVVVNTDAISSVEGIGYFPNLLLLTCNGTSAGSGQLSQLDLSQNPSLLTLSVQNNPLSTLDISCCPNLNMVWCTGNQLTALDLSQNILLTLLHCENNQLKEIDMTQNLQLKNLACDGNPQLGVVYVAKGHTFDNIDRPDLVQEVSSGDGGTSEGYGHGDNGKWD